MTAIECPGLPADWLNSWLASIGLLVLEPCLQLSWTPDASPIAVLTADSDTDPRHLAASAWPTVGRLRAMPIAEHVEGLADMHRTVPLEVFHQRAEFARGRTDSWTLSSTVTDLCVDVGADRTVRHAPLDPKGPGTIKWLHHRLMKTHSMVEDPSKAVIETLKGSGRRVVGNGLGFDGSRIAGLADPSRKLVDPVIEVLAFFGLRMLPMRGDGIEVGTSGTRKRFAVRQRCWHIDTSQPSRVQHMTWPAWSQPLDSSGVDALLDQWSALSERIAHGRRVSRTELERLGIHAAWRTRSYEGRERQDPTVGYASDAMTLDARHR